MTTFQPHGYLIAPAHYPTRYHELPTFFFSGRAVRSRESPVRGIAAYGGAKQGVHEA